jgi:type III restriction enzyme
MIGPGEILAGPRNVVEDPILNGPFEEPRRHFDFSGFTPRVVEGRRAAGYHGIARSDRMGDAALATHEFIRLELVNEIRARVGAWRRRRYPGVTPTTRDLLEHWHEADRQPLFFCQREAAETIIWLVEASAADRQGIEIPFDTPNDLESLRKGYQPLRRYCAKMATGSGKTLLMAMVAAWSILNKVANKKDARFSDAVLAVCPNLTVKERLGVLRPTEPGNYYERFDLIPSGYRELLSKGRVFVTNWHAFAVKDDSVRRGIVQRGRESDAAFVKRVLHKELGNAQNLLVLNDEAHHAYRSAPPASEEEEQLRFQGDARRGGARSHRPASEEEEQLRFQDLSVDEKKEAEDLVEEATVWVGGLDRIHKVRGIRFTFDVSATPFYLRGSGYEEGSPLPWIVSDFGIVDAIESGITKVPRIPIADDSGRPDPKYFRLWQSIMERLPLSERETQRHRAKPEAVWREAQGALSTLAGKWTVTKEHFDTSGYPVPPVLIVVAQTTAIAAVVADALKRGDVLDDFKGDVTFAIDSKVLAEAEAAQESGARDDARELLRLKTATIGKASWPDDRSPPGWEDLPVPPGKDVRCVVSVGMLTEGWDAQNVTQILGLRAFRSQLLCEQVVGRGLRRMSYDVDPVTKLFTPEYCDVFGIPFEVVPVQGTIARPGRAAPPSTLVQALDERKHLAIEFPRVEGYVVDVRERIRCNVEAIPSLHIEPLVEPTAVFVREQVGWALRKPGGGTSVGQGETVTRERFYAEHRLQKTAFGIARDITEVLAGGNVSEGKQPRTARRHDAARLLFPQVLRVVESYLAHRLTVAQTARKEEVALAKYRDVIVERLLAAIEPDTDAGEAALLPRIERHRPLGSTAEVQFRTVRPAQETRKSHISHVVLDSRWESSTAFYLEQSPYVIAYAKNDRLGFEILYEWLDRPCKYFPDFLVRVDPGDGELAMLIVEVKGHEDEQDRAKRTMALKWVRAVNHHGGFGVWDFTVARAPDAVGNLIENWCAEHVVAKDRTRNPRPPWKDPLEDFFPQLEERSRAGKLDAALDLVFDTVDDMLLEGRFTQVNRLLECVPVAQLDPVILIGFLSITGAAREALHSRPALVAAVREALRERMTPEELERAMQGLE